MCHRLDSIRELYWTLFAGSLRFRLSRVFRGAIALLVRGALMTETQRRLLWMIFERGAESASLALSKWLGHDVRLTISEVEQVEIAQAAELLGPPEALVAACVMGLSGPLSGRLFLVFEDRAGLGLVDLLMGQPVGSTRSWGELEQSAAQETTNIVGCAYLNALAAHLPVELSNERARDTAAGEELVPTPPCFLHEFAGSLLEFALMEQALELDQLLLVHTAFASSREDLTLNWTLLFIPDSMTLRRLTAALAALEKG
jgi:chemotaxis protein CheC